MGAAYRCKVGEYSVSTAFDKLGHLIAGSAAAGFSRHFHKQTTAWQAELEAVGLFAAELSATNSHAAEWWLLFEYEIPRREKRPDVILLAGDMVFVLEFKVGAESFLACDEWQVFSYALDLRDFHAESAGRAIVPVLIATSAADNKQIELGFSADPQFRGVLPVQRTNCRQLRRVVTHAFASLVHDFQKRIIPDAWEYSPYRPSLTVIEAAEQLFAGHGVADISHAFATNLNETTSAIVNAVRISQREGRRTICFVTGTPGAGKTLTGLNAVHDPAIRSDDRPSATFLSGNGPLVKIVREALIRDRVRAGVSRFQASRIVSTFIGNVHQFIVHYGKEDVSQAPHEHVVVFDEAQRAWNAKKVWDEHEIDQSEPSLLLQIMERTPNWCTVVALVGGGQEIHDGEGGLEEWGRALSERGIQWRVLASPDVVQGGTTVAGHKLISSPAPDSIDLVETAALHLSESVRSPRARMLSEWVDGLLQNSPHHVNACGIGNEFPVGLTRDLTVARRWLKERSDAAQRAGLLASSGALRLRAHGIEVSPAFRKGYPYPDWFLTGPTDIRSSMRLEVAATEFECQGLELDWTCVCWGDDFLIDPRTGQWEYRKLRGTKWQSVREADARRYLLNKYRVLMTRARRGMVIWVPPGCSADRTRDPQLLDSTAAYLSGKGIPSLLVS